MVVDLSKSAAKPVTTVQNYVSTFVGVTLPDLSRRHWDPFKQQQKRHCRLKVGTSPAVMK